MSPERAQPFRPAWWCPGPHAQTLCGALPRPTLRLAVRRERWETPDGDFLDMDRLEGPPGSPVLLILHGLEGSSGDPAGSISAGSSRPSAARLSTNCAAPRTWLTGRRSSRRAKLKPTRICRRCSRTTAATWGSSPVSSPACPSTGRKRRPSLSSLRFLLSAEARHAAPVHLQLDRDRPAAVHHGR